jgi:hypothetical protein
MYIYLLKVGWIEIPRGAKLDFFFLKRCRRSRSLCSFLFFLKGRMGR